MSRRIVFYSPTAVTVQHELRSAWRLARSNQNWRTVLCTFARCQRRSSSSSSSSLLRRHSRTTIRYFSAIKDTDSNRDSRRQLLEENDEKHEKNHNHSSTRQHTDTTTSSSSSLVWEHWLEQLKSPPNMITVTRIASAPILSYFIVTHQYHAAFWGCFVAGCSDFLDGYLAKHYNMSTVLGTYLDPLADKILINVLSVSLWYAAILPTPLVALWLGRDVILMGATYRHVAIHTKPGQAVWDPITAPLKINPTLTSKVNTALQFLTLTVALIHPVVPDSILTIMTVATHQDIPDAAATTTTEDLILPALCWITGGTTIASAFSYLDYSAFTKSGNSSNNNNE